MYYARSIIGKVPDLLILDEPCSGLDLPAREQFLRTVANLVAEQQTPIIYVSHQIEEILPAITHVAILQEGKMIHAGPKHAVLTDEICLMCLAFPYKLCGKMIAHG